MAAPSCARVLVVDDEAIIRRSLQRTLTAAGHVCLVAASANEAGAIVAGGAVDLVLSDVNMPGASGLELARRITREHPDTAVVMVTGVDDARLAQEAIEFGVYGYVIKPFERNEIVITVANALRRRTLERENRAHQDRLEELVAARTARLEQTLRSLGQAERALRAAHEETIQRLATAAEFRDPFTGVHLQRMSRYAELLALHLGLGPERAELIRLASPLHDIGKIGVPDDVLLKPGRLDGEEMAIMRRHPQIGHEMLADSHSPLLRLGGLIALTHHERWDGTGYPRALRRQAIPVEARIVALADVFDALTTERPYKPAFEVSRALDIIVEGRGSHFDPEIADVFLDHVEDVEAVMRSEGTDPHPPDRAELHDRDGERGAGVERRSSGLPA